MRILQCVRLGRRRWLWPAQFVPAARPGAAHISGWHGFVQLWRAQGVLHERHALCVVFPAPPCAQWELLQMSELNHACGNI